MPSFPSECHAQSEVPSKYLGENLIGRMGSNQKTTKLLVTVSLDHTAL